MGNKRNMNNYLEDWGISRGISQMLDTFQGCFALRDVRVNVPTAVIRGKNAQLDCSYDLEGDGLYSVKWYRSRYEFFRYTPDEKYPIKLFPIKGINVRLNESSATKVVLENVSREISGPFSCEVTAEMPSFYTDMQTAEMQVVDIPKHNPEITGFQNRYTLDDKIFQANCTSAESYPAANITWYINGLPKKGPQIMTRTTNYRELASVVSMLRHRLEKKLFINNRMKLRCAASLYDVYHQSTEVSLELHKKRKHQLHEWPSTTAPPETTLWFSSPSRAPSNPVGPLNVVSGVFILLVFTQVR